MSRAVLGHGLTSASMEVDKVPSEEVASEVMSESWETQVSPQLGTWQDMQHVDQALDMQQVWSVRVGCSVLLLLTPTWPTSHSQGKAENFHECPWQSMKGET